MPAPMLRLAHRAAAAAARPATKKATGNTTYFSTSARRMNDKKPSPIKSVLNRPEITPLFLFTGAIISLAVFFGGQHLVKDKELQIDHGRVDQLKTDTSKLNYEAMAHVADDPEGKLTKEHIDEERNRSKRLKNLRDEKEEKSKQKL